ncbi:ATP-binding protein [Pleomorphomonas sp. PLEO]|uniref:HAMP domain-containing sensor histidine kinase n=1 Tax=Pleomorphomonas sp. PLEO TaxID=3239306 RepID=UPI00351F576A
MSRLFLRLSVVVWLVTALATALVFGISYAVGVFPPNDQKILAKQEFVLATAAKLLVLDGQGAVVAFARQTAAVDPSVRLVLSQEALPSACSGSVDDETAQRLVLRDDVCWRLRLNAPRESWLSAQIPKLAPLLVSVLTSLGAAFWIVRYFMGPLGKLSDGLSGLARGDFSRRIAPDPKQRDELAMLGRDFDQTAARLQEFQQGRERLFHYVSHELRSPLSRLQAVIGVLRKSPTRLEDMLDRMEGEIGRLDELVEEILTLARLSASDSKGLSRQKLDIIDLVTEIIEDACFEGGARGVTVTYQGVASFIADVNGELIYRAIENVIRNAVKFSNPDAEVMVRTSVEGGCLKLEVCDNGPGVREEELESIFRVFARASDNLSTPGHGLGLAIARQAIERHGGTATAEPAASGGLRVVLTISSTSQWAAG